jgi:hypothetical protein
VTRPPWLLPGWLRRRASVLSIVLGLVDGITNALGLAAHSVLHGSAGGLGLALRIAFFALATAVFAVFVARYVELRTDLIQAGKQLNLLERGTLATTRLGRAERLDALADAAQASMASFSGALLPLALAVAFPALGWLPLALALLMLMFLGLIIGRRLSGNPVVWAVALGAAGPVLMVVGAVLDIA